MNVNTLLDRGQCLIKNKEYKAAEDIFVNVLSFLKNDDNIPQKNLKLSEVLNNIGYIFYKQVEFNKAIHYFNESIKLNSTYGIAYYNRGTISYRLGFYESAIRDMELAVVHEPENEEFKLGLAESKYALKLVSNPQ